MERENYEIQNAWNFKGKNSNMNEVKNSGMKEFNGISKFEH